MLVTLMLLCTTAFRHRQRWWDDAPCPVDRAMVWQIDVQTGAHKPYATGLRNPTALAIQPGTGQLWAVVNERDEIGSNLVPELSNFGSGGAFTGWPYSYWGQNVDPACSRRTPTRWPPRSAPTTASARMRQRLACHSRRRRWAQNSRMACSWASMEVGTAARPWATRSYSFRSTIAGRLGTRAAPPSVRVPGQSGLPCLRVADGMVTSA